jgi:hypothetical protein
MEHFLDLGISWSWSASRPDRFIPGEKAPGTHWIGGWVDPRAGLDDMEKRKFLTLPGLEPRVLYRPARSQSDYAIPARTSNVYLTYSSYFFIILQRYSDRYFRAVSRPESP